jgi:hypothetical protein
MMDGEGKSYRSRMIRASLEVKTFNSFGFSGRTGVLLFPRVLIQLVRLNGGAGHHPRWRGRVQVGLTPPS